MSISMIISIHWTVILPRTKITDIKTKNFKVEVYKLVLGFPLCLKNRKREERKSHFQILISQYFY